MPHKLTRLLRPLLAAAVAGAALSGSGCFRRHSIEPGLWELKFTVLRYPAGTKTPRLRHEHTAHVQVDTRFNKGVETVEVWLADAFDPAHDDEVRQDLPPMTGTVGVNTQNGLPLLTLDGSDPTWHLSMWADIRSRTRLRGNLYGRRRPDDDEYSAGTWVMRFLEE